MSLTRASAAVIKTEEIVNNRNRIINGDMRIDQRNAGAAVTTSQSFPVDRFSMVNSTDGAFSAQQDSSAPTGFVNSVKYTTTTADGTLTTTQNSTIRQNIEGTNVADLGWGTVNAKTVTLSFWVRSSLTGTFGGAISNSGQSRSYPFTYSISAADTWEQKSVTIPGDTSGTWLTTTGIGLIVFFGLGAGPDRSGTAGEWSGAQYVSATGAVSVIGTLNATWYVTGVQLEVGSVATPFERRPYGQELMLCQRYYQKSYNQSEKPGGSVLFPSAGTHLSTYEGAIFQASTYNSTYGQMFQTNIRLKVPMRTKSTTITIINPYTGNTGNIMQSGGGQNYPVSSISAYSEMDPSFTATVSGNSIGNTVGDMYRYHWTVSAEL